MREITARETAERLQQDDPPLLLDVREPWEVATACVAAAVTIPMNEIPARLGEVDRSREIVVMCHSGVRSARVAAFLQQSGVTRVLNLTGGIEAWSRDVDPSIPRY